MSRIWQNFFIFSLAILTVVLETSLFSKLCPFNVAVDLSLILVIIWSSRYEFISIWPRVIFLGLVLDFLSFQRVGMGIVSLIIVSFITSSLFKRFLVAQKFTSFFIIGSFIIIGTVVYFFISNALIAGAEYFSSQNKFLTAANFPIKIMLLKLLFNSIIFVIIYWPVNRFEDMFLGKEYKIAVK